jgi:hypothetical protein
MDLRIRAELGPREGAKGADGKANESYCSTPR